MRNKSLLFILGFFLFLRLITVPVFSAFADHIVISEISIGTSADAKDEFIELYNPTDVSVSLVGWRLSRKNSGGTLNNLVTTMSKTIPARGFFLITHLNYTGIVLPDLNYSTGSDFAANSSILLLNGSLIIVDKVGVGVGATDPESSPAPDLINDDKSIERKANIASTIDSMTTGSDVLSGNGEDTDNNSADFLLRTIPDPQNSLSTVEIPPTPTQTPTLTPSPTLTPIQL